MKKNITFFLVRKKQFLIFIILISVLFFATYNFAEAITNDSEPVEVIFKYKNDPEIYIAKIKNENDQDEVLEHYRALEDIEYAEINQYYHASIIPTDTYYNNQWYLNRIKAPEAWNTERESPEVVIAIIDTGVQINHPDLRDNIWINKFEAPDNGIDDDRNGYIDDVNGWDFVNNVADPGPKFKEGFTQDGILHGTVVAGIAAASGNNAAGISGVTWRAKIMPLKALSDKGEGDTRNVVKAVEYAIKNGADIINFSFVGFGYSQALEEVIRKAYNAGLIIVAAAGNEQVDGNGNFLDENPLYPVCYDGSLGENMVIGVAATDALDQKTSFSGYGTKCVDISAPGVSIFSTSVYNPGATYNSQPFNKYFDGYWSGTSMAVPMVSGALALIESANSRLNRQEVIISLLNQTDNITSLNPTFIGQIGQGRLNVNRSVLYASEEFINLKIRLLTAHYSNNTGTIDYFDNKGKLSSSFLAYPENFQGGVNVAVGDVDGDGLDEIVTGAGFTGGPHVRIFSQDGELEGQFFAYDPGFRGGVNVAVGDVDGDGLDEIVTGAGFTGGPHVRIFDRTGRVEGQFFAYDPGFRGGVNVAVGQTSGGTRNNKLVIITAPKKGMEARIKIFDNHTNLINSFLAFQKKFTGGVNLAANDVDLDGVDEIVAGAGPGGAPHVRVFEMNSTLLSSFYAYDKAYSGGVSVSILEYKN